MLPIETWSEIFEFIPRLQLGQSISLVNYHFHSIAYPIMHVNFPRQLFQLNEYAAEDDELNSLGYFIRSLFSNAMEPSYIDLQMEPPKNIIGIRLLYIESVNADVANLLKYLTQHRLIRKVIFYQDHHNTLPKMAVLYPTFFNNNDASDDFKFEILIDFRCELRAGKPFEFAMPKKIFSHPAVMNFPFTMSTAIGDRAFKCGPLVHWLHWRAIGQKLPNRWLQISILGHYSCIFVQNFVSALIQRFIAAKKRCPYQVRFLACWDEWAELLEQEARINSRTGEELHFTKLEKMYQMITYEIRRC